MGKKSSETTIAERKIILNQHSAGKSLSEVGKIVNKSRYTVRSVLKRFKGKTHLENRKRSGRPKKLTEKEERHVIKIVKKSPKTSSTEIAAELKESFYKDATPRTIQNTLRRAGYRARVPRKKPYISNVNQEKRIKFAKEYIHKNLDFWDDVLFSDESKFNLYQSDGRIQVWRKPNTELEKRNMIATVKHSGGGVMVWGCMAASGVGELVFVDRVMDKMGYLNILRQNLKNSAEKLGLSSNYYFQQDNDPKHTAHIVKEWILYNTPHTLKTPPQSPDMNPIEHLWDVLEKRIRNHHIRNKNQLKDVIMEEWLKIGSDVTQKLVSSMPNRLTEVIIRKGLSTHY